MRVSDSEQMNKSNKRKNMNKIIMQRQGDVLIKRVGDAPAAQQANAKTQNVILANGEVTGHMHSVYAPVVADLDDQGGLKFQTEQALGSPINVAELLAFGAAPVKHQEHTSAPMDAGTFKIVRQREYTPEAIRNVAD